MSEERESIKEKFGTWWETQTPDKKRLWFFGVGALALIFVVMMIDSGQSGPKTAEEIIREEPDEVALFSSGDRSADIETISASQNATSSQLQRLATEMEEVRNMMRDIVADFGQVKQLTGDPEMLNAMANKIEDLSRKQKELEDYTTDRIGNSSNPAPSPVTAVNDDEIDFNPGNASSDSSGDDFDLFSDATADADENVDLIGSEGSAVRVKRKDAEQAIINAANAGQNPVDGLDESEGISYGVSILRDTDEEDQVDNNGLRAENSVKGNTTRDKIEASYKEDRAVQFINAGSMFKAFLLNGVVAPTGDTAKSHPIPISMEVSTDAFLPNDFAVDVKKCRIIGVAYGDESSERVHIRTETLSCAYGENEGVEVPLNGWVNGEDGRLGLKGRLVTKVDDLLWNAGVAGALGGLGEGLKPQRVNSVRTGGDAGDVDYDAPPIDAVVGNGVQSGISKGADQISKYYLNKAEGVFAVIEIDAMREITIILKRGVKLEVKDLSKVIKRKVGQKQGKQTNG